MSVSLFFPFSPQWVLCGLVGRGQSSRRFVISFAGAAPEGFAAWARSSSSVVVERVYPCEAWRGFGAGVAVRVAVRDESIAEAIKSAAPSGGGGSRHPGNYMFS
jgi:hypothetical protein